MTVFSGGNGPFTKSLEFIQDAPLEVPPNSFYSSTECCLEFTPSTNECFFDLDTRLGSRLLFPPLQRGFSAG